jgi:hypothetical protein
VASVAIPVAKPSLLAFLTTEGLSCPDNVATQCFPILTTKTLTTKVSGFVNANMFSQSFWILLLLLSLLFPSSIVATYKFSHWKRTQQKNNQFTPLETRIIDLPTRELAFLECSTFTQNKG